jgi:hypothetical protein
MDISEIGIFEMDLGPMAISDFQYIQSYKNVHIGNRDIGYGFKSWINRISDIYIAIKWTYRK